MQGNFAVRVRVQRPKIIRCRGIRDIGYPRIGDVELRSLHRRAAHSVQFVDGQSRGTVVFEYYAPDVSRVEGNRLYPLRLVFREIVGRGNGYLRNLVGSRFYPLGNSSIRRGGPLAGTAVVQPLYLEHRAGNHRTVKRVDLYQIQKGILQILENQFPFRASRQRHRPHIVGGQDIGSGDGSFGNPVTARLHLCGIPAI